MANPNLLSVISEIPNSDLYQEALVYKWRVHDIAKPIRFQGTDSSPFYRALASDILAGRIIVPEQFYQYTRINHPNLLRHSIEYLRDYNKHLDQNTAYYPSSPPRDLAGFYKIIEESNKAVIAQKKKLVV